MRHSREEFVEAVYAPMLQTKEMHVHVSEVFTHASMLAFEEDLQSYAERGRIERKCKSRGVEKLKGKEGRPK